MYHVLENGKPATLPKSHNLYWLNNKFTNFSSALAYARMWLGQEFGGSSDGYTGVHLVVNVPYCFYHSDDYEAWIEIREVKE